MSIKLYHIGCGGMVYFDLSEYFNMVSLPDIRSGRLDFGTITLNINPSGRLLYLCTTCANRIALEQIFAKCSNCGKDNSLSNLFHCKDSNGKVSGIYDAGCMAELELLSVSSIEKILKQKLTLERE